MLEHTLRPIHDAVGYENACAMIDTLAGLDLNDEQEEYLEALSILMEAYEREAEDTPQETTGLEALKFLCEENNMSGQDLASLLGVSRTLGVKLLSGDRNLTTSHIRKLAGRFKVSHSLLITN